MDEEEQDDSPIGDGCRRPSLLPDFNPAMASAYGVLG